MYRNSIDTSQILYLQTRVTISIIEVNLEMRNDHDDRRAALALMMMSDDDDDDDDDDDNDTV